MEARRARLVLYCSYTYIHIHIHYFIILHDIIFHHGILYSIILYYTILHYIMNKARQVFFVDPEIYEQYKRSKEDDKAHLLRLTNRCYKETSVFEETKNDIDREITADERSREPLSKSHTVSEGSFAFAAEGGEDVPWHRAESGPD